MKKRNYSLRIISLLLLLSLLCTACSSPNHPADTEESETEAPSVALPGDGIGRDMPKPPEPKDFVICIDPGHGFWDGGAGEGLFPGGVLEKDINLAVAKKLSEALKNMGFTTVMTHDGVTFPKTAVDDGNQKFRPAERVSYANSLDIDYYISLHVNSYPADPSVSGLRIYYTQNWRKVNADSEPIAQSIADAIDAAMPYEKTPIVFQQPSAESYEVVRETTCPAALVEMGFCTNEYDRNNLVNNEWQNDLVAGIAAGILNFYIGEVE